MRSLSKVLKSVVFESDKPLLLKEHSTASQKNGRMLNNGSLLNKVKHTHQKIYEDAGKRLLEEALVKTREIIEKSKKEAQELISKAEAKKQQIEKEAFSKGYENGMKTAIEQQEVLWNERIKELEKTQKDLKKKNTIFRKNLEEECLKLSLAIAEKILGSTIQADNNLFLNLIRKSMERASEEKDVIIRVSEADYGKTNLLVSDLEEGAQKITLIKDPFLSSGDCIIQGSHFEIDAGVHTQIANIAQTLKELEVIKDG